MRFSDSADLNYSVECISPGLLTLSSRARQQPYDTLPTSVIRTHCHANNYSLRPPAHVSQQALMDLYRGLEGDYDARVVFAGRDHAFVANPSCSRPDTEGGALSSLGALSAPATPRSAHSRGSPVAEPKRAGQSDGQDFRLSAFRSNAKHADTSTPKVCHAFNTPQGCWRAGNCPFLHVAKDGTVMHLPLY